MMILKGDVDGFSYFPLKIVFRKLLDMVRTGQKVTILKGDVDGFSYFPLKIVF